MSRNLSLIAAFGFLTAFPISAVHAADPPNPAEARLRESLRNTMLQLRTSETERATLQAAQAELEQKNTTLTAQVEALTKQMATDKDSSDKNIAQLKVTIDDRDTEIGRLNESLEKWKVAQKQAATAAANTEAQRAKLAADAILLNRRVADQQAKNAAMYKLGTEILTRYEKFGLGDALTAREPFIGITRVKFENLIQDYQDKITDAKIKPEDKNKTPAPPAAEQKSTPVPAKATKSKTTTASLAKPQS